MKLLEEYVLNILYVCWGRGEEFIAQMFLLCVEETGQVKNCLSGQVQPDQVTCPDGEYSNVLVHNPALSVFYYSKINVSVFSVLAF